MKKVESYRLIYNLKRTNYSKGAKTPALIAQQDWPDSDFASYAAVFLTLNLYDLNILLNLSGYNERSQKIHGFPVLRAMCRAAPTGQEVQRESPNPRVRALILVLAVIALVGLGFTLYHNRSAWWASRCFRPLVITGAALAPITLFMAYAFYSRSARRSRALSRTKGCTWSTSGLISQPRANKTSGARRSILSSATLTDKVWAPVSPIDAPQFKPLDEDQLGILLSLENTLWIPGQAAQKTKTFAERILELHKHGILSIGATLNEELKLHIRYIMYRIQQETVEDTKRALLKDLSRGLEDCDAITQSSLSQMYLSFVTKHNFESQIEALIDGEKNAAIDFAIGKLYPETCDSNHNFSGAPGEQFTHRKFGLMTSARLELGVNPPKDSWAKKNHTDDEKSRFIETVKANFSIVDVIKLFVKSLNEGDSRFIVNEDFLAWAGKKGEWQSELFFDEERDYPSYVTEPEECEIATRAFITEELAIKVFRELGYIA